MNTEPYVEKLKQLKKEKKLTYDDIANLTGYSRSTITNIFCGYVKAPRYETISEIERALGLYTERIANSVAEQKEKAPQEYPAGLTSDERILLDYYRRLVPSNKLTVFNLLKSVFKEAKDLPVELVSDYINAYYN